MEIGHWWDSLRSAHPTSWTPVLTLKTSPTTDPFPSARPRPANGSMPGSASASPGISIRRAARRSGSIMPPSSAGIRARRFVAFDDLAKLRSLPGRMAPRRTRAALGAQGLCRPADLRLRDRRQHGHSQEPHQHRGLPHRLLDVQRDAATTSTFPAARTGSCSVPPGRGGCGWPSSTWPRSAAASASASTSIRAGSSA